MSENFGSKRKEGSQEGLKGTHEQSQTSGRIQETEVVSACARVMIGRNAHKCKTIRKSN